MRLKALQGFTSPIFGSRKAGDVFEVTDKDHAELLRGMDLVSGTTQAQTDDAPPVDGGIPVPAVAGPVATPRAAAPKR